MNTEWFKNHCSVLPRPDLILHIGAGTGEELSVYDEFPEARIVLVEPQPALAAKLRQKAAGRPNVEVIECAIDAKPGRAVLNQFNFPMLSSLHSPTGLKQLLPGLKLTGQVEVELRTPEALLDELDVLQETQNWLVIDAPGSESHIVESLLGDEHYRLFKHVFLRTGMAELFEGSEPQVDLTARLERNGFREFTEPDHSDPDWLTSHLVADRLCEQSRELIAEIDDLKANTKSLSEMNARLETRLDQLGADNAQKSDLELEIEKHESALKELNAKHAEEIQRLQSQLEEVRADHSIALRLQAMREADLKELQERYGKVTETRDQQHELLVKLGQRLGAASAYLKEIQGPEGDDSEPYEHTAALVEALSGEAKINK